MKYGVRVLMMALSSFSLLAEQGAWTWNYSKLFSIYERRGNESRAESIFAKQQVPEFTQLIFSWNAQRPVKGFYSFHARIRDAKTKKWGAWHKMIDWGANVQKSYFTKSDGLSQYFHVRLEVERGQKADAFKIKLQSHDGANLGLVRRLAVNISDFELFIPEQLRNLAYLVSTRIANVPQKSQMALNHPRSHELCSPTSSSMMTAYVCDCSVDPIDFANNAFDSGLNVYGSWPFNMAHAYERCSGSVYFSTIRYNSFADLHTILVQGLPVVVSVRGYIHGAPKPYPKGHLLVVIGYDAQSREVLCHDPACAADAQTQMGYPLESFLAAWERSRRLAYVASYA